MALNPATTALHKSLLHKKLFLATIYCIIIIILVILLAGSFKHVFILCTVHIFLWIDVRMKTIRHTTRNEDAKQLEQKSYL